MSNLAVIHDIAPRGRPLKSPDLRATVADLRRRHRRGDTDEVVAEKLITLMTQDADLMLQASRFVVEKIGAAIDAQARRREAAERAPSRAVRRTVEKAAVAEIVEQVKAAVLDSVLTLPSGESKKLHFATGAELAELGAAYTRLAAAIPPDVMLGECLTETEAAALLCT